MEEVTEQKAYYKSKTFWVAAFTVLSALLATATGVDITQGAEGTTVGMVLGIVFGVLRFVTGVSIGIEDINAK